MPLLSSQSGNSAKAFGLTSSLFSKVGNGYWINKNSLTSRNLFPSLEIDSDSSGNVYVAGTTTPATTTGYLTKYNSSGAAVWSKELSISGNTVENISTTVDSSGNVYVVGFGFSSFSGVSLLKYNSSGVLQFQKTLYNTVTNSTGISVRVDSSGNIYIGGRVFPSVGSQTDAFIMKLDSSANILWQRFLSGTSNTFQGIGAIELDSSSNVYAIGYDTSSTPGTSFLVKYNSSGVLQWQRKLSDASYNLIVYSLDIDSSSNVYVSGVVVGTESVGVLAKYNSSGTVQWRLNITYTGGTSIRQVDIDSSDNVYCLAVLNAPGTGWGILKFDSSGTLQWAREVGVNVISSDGGVGATGTVQGSSYYSLGYRTIDGFFQTVLTNFPTDGSKTGVYDVGGATVQYTILNATVNSGTYLDSVNGLTDSAGNFNAPFNQSGTDSTPAIATAVRD